MNWVFCKQLFKLFELIDPEKIREKAIELGFSACGFAKAEPLPLKDVLNKWLDKSNHGQMKYMEKNRDLRLDPTLLFPGAKTVITLMASYYNDKFVPSEPLKVSRYAPGRDYHKVLKKNGQKLIDWITLSLPDMSARIFVDSAPLMEKEWARRSGLGWIGKNTCLIRPGSGSWFFLAVILTNLEINPDPAEERDMCGNCTRCVDACPTKALSSKGSLDARKCISYQTIELRDNIPGEFKGKTEFWLFGCDRCQEVCPHNRFAKNSIIDELAPRKVFENISPQLINEMDQEEFDRKFSGTAFKRVGLEKLKQTSSFLYPDV